MLAWGEATVISHFKGLNDVGFLVGPSPCIFLFFFINQILEEELGKTIFIQNNNRGGKRVYKSCGDLNCANASRWLAEAHPTHIVDLAERLRGGIGFHFEFR